MVGEKSMYNDYNVVHVSHFGIMPEVIMGILIIISIILLIILITKALVNKKAHKPWWSSFIPFYSLAIEIQIATLPMWYYLLALIPVVNIFAFLKINVNIAKAFNKKPAFGIGLMFLPFIFYPILAFDKSEYYGINNEAFETYTIDPNTKFEEEQEEELANPLPTTAEISRGMATAKVYTGSSITNLNFDSNQPIIADFKVEIPEVKEETQTSELLEEPVQDKVKTQDLINSIQDYYTKIKIENKNTNTNQINDSNLNQQITFNKSSSTDNQGFVTCPKCKAQIKKGATNCFLCGAKLEH